MRRSLRLAWRALRARPALTLSIFVTFALGVGANAAMLGALDALLFRAPEHVRDADGILRLYVARRDAPGEAEEHNPSVSYPFFQRVRREVPSLAAVAAISDPGDMPLGTGPDARSGNVRGVSPEFFALTGARPALGRWFTPAEDREEAAVVPVVIGHALWRGHFGGDPQVLGRRLQVGTMAARVVGVAPPRFAGVDFARVDVWVPIRPAGNAWMNLMGSPIDQPGMTWLELVARPRPGRSAGAIAAEATAAFRAIERERGRPAARVAATRIVLGPLQQARGPEGSAARRLPLWLGATSLALLLAAAANATGLLLTRALERRTAIAVRTALGAREWHLARDAGAEALVLALGSALAAAGLAAALGGVVRRHVLPEQFAALPVYDLRRAVLTAAIALAVCLLGALVATAVARRAATTELLRAAGRGTTRRVGRALGTLVGAQVALAFVLVAAAGLFATSLRRALAERTGVDAARVLAVSLGGPTLVMDFDTSAAGRARQALQREAYRRAEARVRALPGVTGTAFTSAQPYRSLASTALYVPGMDSVRALEGGGPYFSRVSPGYLEVLGTRLLAGRAPVARPEGAAGREVVVSALAARLLWPGREALGRCVRIGAPTEPCATVVGVAEDVRRFRLTEERAMYLYVGTDFSRSAPAVLLVRTRGDAAGMAAAVTRAVAELDPTAPPPEVTVLADAFARGNYRPYRAGASLLGAFGALALALVGAGLFGMVSYALAQRTREVGVRLALGAQARHVTWLLMRGALAPVALGVAAGAALAAAGARLVRALLYGVTPHDPQVALAGAAVLLGVALLACWIPARRAWRVAPAHVLRAE